MLDIQSRHGSIAHTEGVEILVGTAFRLEDLAQGRCVLVAGGGGGVGVASVGGVEGSVVGRRVGGVGEERWGVGGGAVEGEEVVGGRERRGVLVRVLVFCARGELSGAARGGRGGRLVHVCGGGFGGLEFGVGLWWGGGGGAGAAFEVFEAALQLFA